MNLKQTIKFDAAHRLYKYEGNCGNLHGHTWQVDIEIDSNRELDDIGMLIDYRVIKQYFKDFWDHRLILNMDDPLLDVLKTCNQQITIMAGNPTAENISKKVLADMVLLADLDVKGTDWCKVVVHESEDNSAEVTI